MKIGGRYYRMRWLTLLYACAVAALCAALFVEGLAPVHGPVLQSSMGALLVLAIVVLVVTGLRLARFRAKAYTLLRRLVNGDYQSGMRTSRVYTDEISEVEQLLNRLVERLRQYDDLRTARIRQLRMTLDLLLETVGQPTGLLDVEKDTMAFNPAMAALLDTGKRSIKLDALRNLEANQAFLRLLTRTVEEERCPQEGTVSVLLPGQESSREVRVRILPYKDKNGAVSMALLLGESNSQQPQ